MTAILDFAMLPPEVNSARMYSGPEPAPEYIRAELTSGGSIAKSSMAVIVDLLR